MAVFGGTNSPSVWTVFDPVQMACLAPDFSPRFLPKSAEEGSNYLQGKKFVFSVREVEEWTASAVYKRGRRETARLSSSKGDVGGKGRRCVTAPAHYRRHGGLVVESASGSMGTYQDHFRRRKERKSQRTAPTATSLTFFSPSLARETLKRSRKTSPSLHLCALLAFHARSLRCLVNIDLPVARRSASCVNRSTPLHAMEQYLRVQKKLWRYTIVSLGTKNCGDVPFMVVAKATCSLYTQSTTAVLSNNIVLSSGALLDVHEEIAVEEEPKNIHQMPTRACDRIMKKNLFVMLFSMIHRV